MNAPVTLTTTLDVARQAVDHHLDLLESGEVDPRLVPPLMLWGPPGVGKSALVREVCEARGIGLVDVRLAQREPVDVRGLPVPDGDVVRWLLPDEWPTEGRGIVLFDELTAADRTLQVAAYELILDRRLGSLYTLPDGWYVMAAGNRTSDRAVATTLSSALANRFCHLEIAADLDGWVGWARTAGVHPLVIAFLRFSPDAFFDMDGPTERGWPSPRSWERMGVLVQRRQSLPDEVFSALVRGLVGDGAGTSFLAFVDHAEALPDVEAMLRGEHPVTVPERIDQRYALCTSVAWRVWRMDDVDTALEVLFELGRALPSDFASLLLFDAIHDRPPADTLRVIGHPGFSTWSERHGDAFREALTRSLDAR